MTQVHTEKNFEQSIETFLTDHGGYVKGNPDYFDAESALDTSTLLTFIKASQPENWEKLQEIHGENVEKNFIDRLQKALENNGMLNVLRQGIDDYGVHFDLAYFKPESGLNPDTIKRYNQNILTVTRQVHFSLKDPDKSVDMVLFVNGLPVATVELKNPFTGQDVSNAKNQFAYTRDQRETLFNFKSRALVHFAVDPKEVFMTTKLDGEDTKFLPFNKGYKGGQGNPPVEDDYRTSYLWKEVWVKDSWMDILKRFIHLEEKEVKVDGKIKTKEKMIFPRYHQLDVVRSLVYDSRTSGVGKNYLIQHSAGSGKSNSIAWLAYHLASLHDKDDNEIFDSVVVVTDRVVLDQQLQNTIYQFDHKTGVVEKIDKNSQQLGDALNKGVKIIITTVQKFPYILDRIGEFSGKKYAVIVDEAHSSQGGETSTKMKAVLSQFKAEDEEDLLRLTMKARGRQQNLSFYAFTATPKAKTLEVFGVEDEYGRPQPYHLYSMRQAIEEGFILDVLKNYTTYKTAYRVSKAIEDDPELNKKKTQRAIFKYVKLHSVNLSQRAEEIVEHFRQVTMKKIGGEAKAMVVTSSREHAYRYWLALNKYLQEKGYDDVRTLVAFSGDLIDEQSGDKVTEAGLNDMSEKELPEKFSTGEYQILIVADKYQTGFDQPLLHTMYVDKRLSGVQAVQTLSRLNRTHPGKEDTFVLDFQNTVDDIQDAFQPYYEKTMLTDTTNPNLLYDLKSNLMDYQVFLSSEVDQFAKIFYKPEDKQDKSDQAKLYAIIDPALERFNVLKKEKQDGFRSLLISFVRTYAFLAQVMPFTDEELEKLYTYSRLLRNSLPKEPSERFELNDEVALKYYRMKKVSEDDIELKEEDGELKSKSSKLREGDEEKYERLSFIIEAINDRFGKDLSDADKLIVEQLEEDALEDEELVQQAKQNSKGNFKYAFDDKFEDMLIERMGRNEEFVLKILNDKIIREKIASYLIDQLYTRIEREDIPKIIKQGESSKLEFKSSLRWDVKENQVNKGLEKSVLKTIAAFLNSEGGQLVIGVEDNGTVYGLENDYKALKNGDRDKFENHLMQIFTSTIGSEFIDFINVVFDEMEGKDVCLVTVLKAPKPIYYENDELFIRRGNNTVSLNPKESLKYIENHWKIS